MQAGITDSAVESEVLLRHALSIDRAAFYSSLRDDFTGKAKSKFDHLLERRARREPLAYIIGRREFYGIDFAVTPDVLIPRQETELLIELALKRLKNTKCPKVLDIGTGSGCVGLSIALHATSAHVHGIDISEDAIEIAVLNRNAHGLDGRVTISKGELGSVCFGSCAPFEMVLSNPPYIPSAVIDTLEPEVLAEPRIALDGGSSGLDVVESLIKQAPNLLADSGWLLIEIYSDLSERILSMATEMFSGRKVALYDDLLGLPRVLEIGPRESS